MQFKFHFSTATEAVHFQNTKGVAKNMSAPLELIASGIFLVYIHVLVIKGSAMNRFYMQNKCLINRIFYSFVSDVLDHYRTYALLERLLYTPTKLSEQPSFQLEPQSQQLLIEKYVV